VNTLPSGRPIATLLVFAGTAFLFVSPGQEDAGRLLAQWTSRPARDLETAIAWLADHGHTVLVCRPRRDGWTIYSLDGGPQ
jgi:hypothetical protein